MAGSGANSELSQIRWVLLGGLESGSDYAARAACQIFGIVAVGSPSLLIWNCFFLISSARFDATDHHRCRPETLQSQHRAQPLFDSSMVLFDDVVEVFACPYRHALRQLPITLQVRHRPV
jgi:hypothetical protein